MKDDVVKAMEIHANRGDCRDCPYKGLPVGYCQKQMYTDLLEIFKRQQAEIERLKEKAKGFQALWYEAEGDLRISRAEAIEEFADRLRGMSEFGTINVSSAQLDNLVKEMTEGT